MRLHYYCTVFKTLIIADAPYQRVLTICPWFVGKLQTCNVSFYGNPPASFVSLVKKGIVFRHFQVSLEK